MSETPEWYECNKKPMEHHQLARRIFHKLTECQIPIKPYKRDTLTYFQHINSGFERSLWVVYSVPVFDETTVTAETFSLKSLHVKFLYFLSCKLMSLSINFNIARYTSSFLVLLDENRSGNKITVFGWYLECL